MSRYLASDKHIIYVGSVNRYLDRSLCQPVSMQRSSNYYVRQAVLVVRCKKRLRCILTNSDPQPYLVRITNMIFIRSNTAQALGTYGSLQHSHKFQLTQALKAEMHLPKKPKLN